MRTRFPFSALLGQERLQLALLLLAIDPRIGGVLIQGPRGTAKSTSARALADLLPGAAFVTLPLGATEEMLIGSLNIESALQASSVQFAPGLLAKADNGVLYVDEVNLLPDSLVDPLLDVAASGVNVVERDGISHEHSARFALIGTMNPEEGELRPQLLDRFGLSLTLENCADLRVRSEIVRSRLQFDENPRAFVERFLESQEKLKERLSHARSLLSTLAITEPAHERVSELCLEAQVEGMRADLVMIRAARAFAAWQSDELVTPAHVDAIADLALHHRRRAMQSAENTANAANAAGAANAVNAVNATNATNAATAVNGVNAANAMSAANAANAVAGERAWGALEPQPAPPIPAQPVPPNQAQGIPPIPAQLAAPNQAKRIPPISTQPAPPIPASATNALPRIPAAQAVSPIPAHPIPTPALKKRL